MQRRPTLRSQEGFTIVEVMVAAFVLLVGLAGTVTMINQANATTTSNKAREQGVNLQRELVEAARGLPYDQITPTSVVDDIRSQPGFSSSTIGSKGWTVVRRGITFTMSVGVCTVDDPGDGIGTHDTATFCADGAGTTSAASCKAYIGTNGDIAGTGQATGGAVGDCGLDTNYDGTVDGLTEAQAGASPPASTGDKNPDDYKRIVTLVRWDRGSGSRFALQSSTIPYPGLSAAPRVGGLSANPESSLSAPLGPNVDRIAFTATTDRKAASVGWFVDGTPFGTATDDGTGQRFTFTWDLKPVNPSASAPAQGEILDGTYQVGAQAYDPYGSGGAQYYKIVVLNRRIPFPPSGVVGARINDHAEFVWSKSPETDIQGYSVYRTVSGTKTYVCTVQRDLSCTDSAPPSVSSLTYSVVAVDQDGSSNREGQTTDVTLNFQDAIPGVPQNVHVDTSLSSGTKTVLAWDPVAGATGYEVYRDGTSLRNRYSGVVTGTSYSDVSVGDGTHDYWVAAVNAAGESAKSLKVSYP